MPILRGLFGVVRYTLFAMVACFVFSGNVFGEKGTYLWAWDWEGWGGPGVSNCPMGCVCPGETFVAKARNMSGFCDGSTKGTNNDSPGGGVTCSKVTDDSKYNNFYKCEPAAWIGVGDDGVRGRDPFYRCPDDYPYTDGEKTLSELKCYALVDPDYKIESPRSSPTACVQGEICPGGKVYYGDTLLAGHDYAGIVNLDVKDSEFDAKPMRFYVKAVGSNYAAYYIKDDLQIDLVDQQSAGHYSNPNTRVTHMVKIEGGTGDKEFIGFFDSAGNKKMQVFNHTGEYNPGIYAMLTGTSNKGYTDFFPDAGSQTATWYAKYAKAYVVTLNLNNGTDETRNFKVYDGKAYDANGFSLGSSTNTLFAFPIDIPTKDGYVFDGFYYNGEEMIEPQGGKGDGFDSIVSDLTRNLTWTAQWKKIYKVKLSSGGSTQVAFQVFDGLLYGPNVTDIKSSEPIDVSNFNVFTIEGAEITDKPTREGSSFAGYYYNGVEMIDLNGNPGEGFAEAIETMNGDRTWTAKWSRIYTIKLLNGCSEDDKPRDNPKYECLTELSIRSGEPYGKKLINAEGKEEERQENFVEPVEDGKVGVPTMSGYTFDGYTYNDINVVNKSGVITKYGNELMSDMTTNLSWTAKWKQCATGKVYNNTCNTPKNYQYLEESGATQNCPGYDGKDFSLTKLFNDLDLDKTKITDAGIKDEWYKFVNNDKINSFGIERCTIKYYPNSVYGSHCGAGTNVLYVYDEKAKTYVLDPDSYVVTGPQSNSVKKLPEIFNIDIDDEGNFIHPEMDFCSACGGGLYNVNGKCGICNAGYCVDNSNECVKCPAGYKCPAGNEESNENLMCADVTDGEKADLFACPMDTYSREGSTDCVECAEGYSTKNSGPASSGKNGLCLLEGKINMRRKGEYEIYGRACTSVRACLMMQPNLYKYGKHGQCGQLGGIGSSFFNRCVGWSFPLDDDVKTLKIYSDYVTKTVKSSQQMESGQIDTYGSSVNFDDPSY